MGCVVGLFTGGWSLEKAAKAKKADFSSVIATGNGETLEVLSKQLHEGDLKPVIDRVFKFNDALDAISYHWSAGENRKNSCGNSSGRRFIEAPDIK